MHQPSSFIKFPSTLLCNFFKVILPNLVPWNVDAKSNSHFVRRGGRMEGLLVLKEETVATSLAGLVCDPSAFIVEEYSEEVGGPHRFG